MMLELPRVRFYRLLLYVAVSALVAGTVGVSLEHRLLTVFVYLSLGLVGVGVHSASERIPKGGLWQLAVCLDILSHAVVVFRMGGMDGPFLLLLGLPILSWGIVRGMSAGLLAALASVVVDLGRVVSGHGVEAPWEIVILRSVAFLLLGAFSALLGRRALQIEAARQRTQAELERVQLDASSIVSSLSSGLLCFDPDGKVRMVNGTAQGLLSSELLLEGVSLDELSRETHLRSLVELLRESLLGADRRTSELEIPEGPPIEVKTTPIVGPAGEVRGLVALLLDVTERRARETERKREERLALVGQLSAGLAHEIRNSLKPITGSIELLRQDLPTGEGVDSSLMEIILREAESLESFLSEFLAFARDKALQIESISLERVVEEEAESLSTVSSRDIRVVRPDEGSREVCVLSDRAALGQVIRNLGVNALEASDEDAELVLGWKCERQEAVVYIRDRGPGIPSEILARVTDPFFTTKAEGTGLGLAIVRDLVERMEGRLNIEAAPGGGTLVEVTLKIADTESAVPQGEKAA